MYIDPDNDVDEAALIDRRAPSFKEKFLRRLGLTRRPYTAPYDVQDDLSLNDELPDSISEDEVETNTRGVSIVATEPISESCPPRVNYLKRALNAIRDGIRLCSEEDDSDEGSEPSSTWTRDKKGLD